MWILDFLHMGLCYLWQETAGFLPVWIPFVSLSSLSALTGTCSALLYRSSKSPRAMTVLNTGASFQSLHTLCDITYGPFINAFIILFCEAPLPSLLFWVFLLWCDYKFCQILLWHNMTWWYVSLVLFMWYNALISCLW